MRVALFVPCYVDQLAPGVGLAALEVLERHGVEVEFPRAQTCCGQPLANAGLADDARSLARKFLRVFGEHEAVVAPSGSCVAMVRRHYAELLPDEPGLAALAARTFELCEFLSRQLGVERARGRFAHRVGLHPSCHALRELRSGPGSELALPAGDAPPDLARRLLASLEGIELAELARPDECCGFGGTFAVGEAEVSCMMGLDRLADHRRAGSEIVTSVDASCLLHLDGLIRRQQLPLRTMHVAEILAAADEA